MRRQERLWERDRWLWLETQRQRCLFAWWGGSDGLSLINISCVRVGRLLFILEKMTLVGTQSDFHVPLFWNCGLRPALEIGNSWGPNLCVVLPPAVLTSAGCQSSSSVKGVSRVGGWPRTSDSIMLWLGKLLLVTSQNSSEVFFQWAPEETLNSFIYSFNKSVSDIILGTGHLAVNKTCKSQVANTRPEGRIRPSTLFYPAWHLVSTRQ